jgi:hypothetical protein
LVAANRHPRKWLGASKVAVAADKAITAIVTMDMEMSARLIIVELGMLAGNATRWGEPLMWMW